MHAIVRIVVYFVIPPSVTHQASNTPRRDRQRRMHKNVHSSRAKKFCMVSCFTLRSGDTLRFPLILGRNLKAEICFRCFQKHENLFQVSVRVTFSRRNDESHSNQRTVYFQNSATQPLAVYPSLPTLIYQSTSDVTNPIDFS
jgi:hypothetical protein